MRDGYNTDWLWKQWRNECSAATQALKTGDLDAADAALTRAENYSVELAEIEQAASHAQAPLF